MDESQSGGETPAAVLDEAHLGDIEGAFGTIRQHDSDRRRTWGARLLGSSSWWATTTPAVSPPMPRPGRTSD